MAIACIRPLCILLQEKLSAKIESQCKEIAN